MSKSTPEGERPGTFKLFKNGMEIPPEDLPMRLAASGKELHDYEFDIINHDGTPRHLLGNVRPLYDDQGNTRGSVAAFIDITKRKRSEDALRKSWSILAKSQEMAHVGNWAWNVQTGEINSSDEIYRIYGYEPGDVHLCEDWIMTRAHPDDLTLSTDFIHSVKLDGTRKSVDYRIVRQNGVTRYVTTVADKIVRDKAGKVKWVYGITQDITERKKAEEALKKAHDSLEDKVKERTAELETAYNALKESEQSLTEAQKMAHVGNWKWDVAADKACWSDELYRIYGRSLKDAAPALNEFLNYVHPDDLNYVTNTLNEGPREDPFFIDFRIILASGEERSVHMQSETIFDEGTPVQVKGTVQDITENKKSEEKIRILANIVESSNDAIGTVSLDGTFTGWNKGAEIVYGYSQEEILGRPISILAPSNLDKETKKLIEKIVQGEQVHHYETSRVRKDGKLIDVSLNLSPVFDAYGKLNAISIIARDVTERKKIEEKLRESEEKYRNIVETANEGIIVIDNEAKITFANKRMADMLGYTLEENIGRPIWDFLFEESKDIVQLNLKNRRSGIDDSYELKSRKKNGSILWTLVNSKSLLDKKGEFIGLMSMVTDITRRKEAEQALANFEKAREKEIHHRIKNNLQIVSSLLDLQAYKFIGRNDIKDSEVLALFRESQSRVTSMALVHEGLYKGGLETINISEYVERLADNLLSIYRHENIDININKDVVGDLLLDMDTAIPLGVIINELVSNSFKFAFPDSDRGEIRIILHRVEGEFINVREECECKDPDRTNLILTVSDNGVGIPENFDIENIDTLGLELVTCQVAQLDGELEIKRNIGTEFTIKFTIKEKDNQVSRQPII